MTVTVSPNEFNMVDFDAAEIQAIGERLVAQAGLPDGFAVTIEVDQTSPLGRSWVVSTAPLHLRIEGGALEDPKRPRQLSVDGTAEVIGRQVLQEVDRLDPAFEAPAEGRDAVDLPYRLAWDIYAQARLVGLGYRNQRQRWIYHFRNRCGFTDEADTSFDRLWSGNPMTWAEIRGLVDDLVAVEAA